MSLESTVYSTTAGGWQWLASSKQARRWLTGGKRGGRECRAEGSSATDECSCYQSMSDIDGMGSRKGWNQTHCSHLLCSQLRCSYRGFTVILKRVYLMKRLD